MLTTLSRMYTDTLGAWVSAGFLIGAIAVLGSTMWGSLPAYARMYTNLLATVGAFDWQNSGTRLRWIRIFTVALPIIWGAAYLLISAPVLMVQIGGIMTGVFLLGVLAATWYLRNTEVDRRLHGGTAFNALLVISSISIVLVGIYTILSAVGVG